MGRREGYRVALSFGGRERLDNHTAGRNRLVECCMRGLFAASGEEAMLAPRAWSGSISFASRRMKGVVRVMVAGVRSPAGDCTGFVEPEPE